MITLKSKLIDGKLQAAGIPPLTTRAQDNSLFRVFRHSLGYIVASNIGQFHLLEFYTLRGKPRGYEYIKFHRAIT